MLNLFKKTKQVAQAVKQSFKDPQTIVAEIHEAFDTATEKLLADAKAVLSGEYDTEKGERLSKLGFTASKKAAEAKKVTSDKSANEKLAKRIEYFQTYYPNNKFITEDKVKAICQKYGLLKATVNYYIGDVPEKNIVEIEGFKLRDEDCIACECRWYTYAGGGYYTLSSRTEEGAAYGYIESSRSRGYSFTRCDESKKVHYQKPPLEICASVKDFDTKYMHIEEGYKLEQNLPDPIVLQPVAGGYLVVSKWGLEANDESLINEKQN